MVEKLLWLLTALNVLQFVFWSRTVSQLVDKLMSRNYSDYVTSQHYSSPPSEVDFPEKNVIEDDVLSELNHRLNGI